MDELTKKRANDLALEYQETEDEDVFNELFEICSREINQRAMSFKSKWHVDLNELISEGNFLVFKLAKTYAPLKGDFLHLLHRSLSNKFQDVVRDNKAERNIMSFTVETDDGETDINETCRLESTTMYSQEYGLFDEDEFIDSEILRSALELANPEVQETARLFLEYGSFTDVAHVLGNISPQGVKKRIMSLSKFMPDELAS